MTIEIFEREGKLGIKVEDMIIVPAVYDRLTRLEGSNVFEAVVFFGEHAGVYFVNAYGDSMNHIDPHYREMVECYNRWRKLPAELAEAQRNVVILRNERNGLLGTKDLLEERIKELEATMPKPADTDAKCIAHELDMAKQRIASRDAEIRDMTNIMQQFAGAVEALIAIAKRSKEASDD